MLARTWNVRIAAVTCPPGRIEAWYSWDESHLLNVLAYRGIFGGIKCCLLSTFEMRSLTHNALSCISHCHVSLIVMYLSLSCISRANVRAYAWSLGPWSRRTLRCDIFQCFRPYHACSDVRHESFKVTKIWRSSLQVGIMRDAPRGYCDAKIIDRAPSPCNMVKFFWAMMNISYWSECSRCIGHIATPLTVCIPCCPVIANFIWTAFHILVRNESVPVGPLNQNAHQLVYDASWIMESMLKLTMKC